MTVNCRYTSLSSSMPTRRIQTLEIDPGTFQLGVGTRVPLHWLIQCQIIVSEWVSRCTCSDVTDVPHAHAVLLSSEGVDEGQVGAAGGAEHHPLDGERHRGSTQTWGCLISLVYSSFTGGSTLSCTLLTICMYALPSLLGASLSLWFTSTLVYYLVSSSITHFFS